MCTGVLARCQWRWLLCFDECHHLRNLGTHYTIYPHSNTSSVACGCGCSYSCRAIEATLFIYNNNKNTPRERYYRNFTRNFTRHALIGTRRARNTQGIQSHCCSKNDLVRLTRDACSRRSRVRTYRCYLKMSNVVRTAPKSRYRKQFW